MMSMRFQRDISRAAARTPSGLFERKGLGVLHACVNVKALADDLAPAVNDDAADERPGTHLPRPARSQLKRARHHALVERVRRLESGVWSH